MTPAKLIILSFLSAIGVGTALLMLPGATLGPPLSFIDALFMATSSVCVTGLSVVDIGSELTWLGQGVLLGLFQIGGLGIMTFSLVFSVLFGVRTSLAGRLSVSAFSRYADAWGVFHALLFALGVTFCFEVIGALLLYPKMAQLHPAPEALFSAIFHAVSAFCNAGFSLYGASLSGFRLEPGVLSVFMALIVLGGVGFIVLDELRRWVWNAVTRKEKTFRLSLHTRIALAGTLLLVVGGAAVIWLLEKDRLLSGMAMPAQIANALFLSITSRTAGFNTIETAFLTNGTLFFVISLMFIGGCPGSVAGGVKIHTLAIFLGYLKSALQGRRTVALFQRQIPRAIVGRSVAIIASAFLILHLAVLLLQAVETSGVIRAAAQGRFLSLLFEATSALGTVGLSMGITSALSSPGKLLIVLLMFVGRVGPLTMALAILERQRRQVNFECVEEEILIG